MSLNFAIKPLVAIAMESEGFATTSGNPSNLLRRNSQPFPYVYTNEKTRPKIMKRQYTAYYQAQEQ